MTSVVVIFGPPASGKTTIGRYLGQQLRVPFLSRDDFKPVVHELVREGGLDGQKAGQASRELWLVALGAVLDSGVPAIADGVFNHPQHVAAFSEFVARRRVQCFELRLVCDADTSIGRFGSRGDPAMTEELAAAVAAAARSTPTAIVASASASTTVATTDLASVDLEALAALVRRWLRR